MANTKSKNRQRVVLLVTLALVVGGVAGGVYWRKREKPIVVQTEKAARRDLTELVVATGKIQPVVQVMINPEVSGEIVEVNPEVEADPSLVNTDPYGKGWIFKLKVKDAAHVSKLMDAAAYAAQIS